MKEFAPDTKQPAADKQEVSLPATIENVARAIEFVTHRLADIGCPQQVQTKLAVVVDEIVGNIAKYAYGASTGNVTVRVSRDLGENVIEVVFIDKGIAFNPLNVPRQDAAAVVASRKIGGQGVPLVRAFVDEIEYEREGDRNILRVRKRIAQ